MRPTNNLPHDAVDNKGDPMNKPKPNKATERRPDESFQEWLARITGFKIMTPRERQAFIAYVHARQTIREGELLVGPPYPDLARKR